MPHVPFSWLSFLTYPRSLIIDKQVCAGRSCKACKPRTEKKKKSRITSLDIFLFRNAAATKGEKDDGGERVKEKREKGAR